MLIQRNRLTSERRYWEEDVPFNAGEWETIDSTQNDPVVDEVIEKSGFLLGDLVEKAIQLIPEPARPRHCSKCEKRKQVLNRIRELGVIETLKQLKATSV